MTFLHVWWHWAWLNDRHDEVLDIWGDELLRRKVTNKSD